MPNTFFSKQSNFYLFCPPSKWRVALRDQFRVEESVESINAQIIFQLSSLNDKVHVKVYYLQSKIFITTLGQSLSILDFSHTIFIVQGLLFHIKQQC